MKINVALKRGFYFLLHRRRDVFSREFYSTLKRVIYRHLNKWEEVSSLDFKKNIETVSMRPWNLHIELTNLCNANCIFCAYQYQTRKHSVMSDKVYLKALDDYCNMGGGNIVFCSVVGDSLVDKNAISRIKKARQRPQINHISLTTNAIGLKKNQHLEFILSGVSSLTISTAPWDKELYQKIFRTGSYQKMRENVTGLLKVNQSLSKPIPIKLAFRSNLSINETLKLPDYLEIKNLPHNVEFNTDYDTWGGNIRKNDLLPGMVIRPPIKIDSEPCQWFYHGPVIFPSGDVGVCGCRDYNAEGELILGNVQENSIHELWGSKKMQQLREGFYHRQFPEICKKCTNYVNLDLYRRKQGSSRAKYIKTCMENSPVVDKCNFN